MDPFVFLLLFKLRRTNTEQKVAGEIELWYSPTQAQKKNTTHDKQWQNCILAMFGGYNGCEWHTKEPKTQQRKTH